MTRTVSVSTRSELMAKARELHPLLREFAAYGDTHRRTADQVIAGLEDAGMFRLFTPRRFGGYEADLSTLLGVTETLGESDGSASWLVGVAATSGWLTAHGSEHLLQEVFGANPDSRLAGGGAGAGTGRPVDGGRLVTGRWTYASGTPHAAWAGVFTTLTDGQDEPTGLALCFVPIEELEVEDTWHTLGLRGTGSNALIAREVFVPQHRLIDMAAFSDEAQSTLPPLYRLPMKAVGGLSVIGPLLGIGRAALAHVVETAPHKAIPYTVFGSQSESVGVQLQVADAALRLRTATLHAHSAATTLTDHALEARPVQPLYQAQTLAEISLAAQEVLAAVNILLTVHGSGGLGDASPMQRLVRDVDIGARHAAVNSSVSMEVFGKALLGVTEQVIRGQ